MNTSATLRNSLLIAVLVPTLMYASSPLRGTLHLDGILVLRGEHGSPGRVVIIPLDEKERVMEDVEGRFSADILLDHAYLLSFEHAGMVTKQIYFDTSVPVERRTSVMEFPFKVTLNPHGRDGVYAYAGPVGVVRYIAAIDDFGYTTDHTLKPGAPFADRIIQLMGRSSVAVPDLLHDVPAKVDPRRKDEDPLAGMSTLAATVHSEAPMVNRITYVLPVEVNASRSSDTSVTQSFPSDPAGPSDTRDHVTASDPRDERAMVHDASRTLYADRPMEMERIIRGELIVDRSRVTTVLWVTGPNGTETEYRRVADGRGSVVYFQDGRNIPAYLYQQGTGR